jgi:hypothetical protein
MGRALGWVGLVLWAGATVALVVMLAVSKPTGCCTRCKDRCECNPCSDVSVCREPERAKP